MIVVKIFPKDKTPEFLAVMGVVSFFSSGKSAGKKDITDSAMSRVRTENLVAPNKKLILQCHRMSSH